MNAVFEALRRDIEKLEGAARSARRSRAAGWRRARGEPLGVDGFAAEVYLIFISAISGKPRRHPSMITPSTGKETLALSVGKTAVRPSASRASRPFLADEMTRSRTSPWMSTDRRDEVRPEKPRRLAPESSSPLRRMCLHVRIGRLTLAARPVSPPAPASRARRAPATPAG